jgi:hypothetical protein
LFNERQEDKMPIWIQSAGYLAAYGVAGTAATLVWFLVVLQWERTMIAPQRLAARVACVKAGKRHFLPYPS